MATTAPIYSAEYLRSSYEPDAEYAEGRIEERAVGEREHSDLQRQLLILLSEPSFQRFLSAIPNCSFRSLQSDFGRSYPSAIVHRDTFT